MNSNTQSINDVLAKYSNARPITKAVRVKNTQDTIEEARQKVCDKALLSKSTNPNPTEKFDPIYVEDSLTGTYSVGLKYGNRWLDNVFGEGKKHLQGLTVDDKDLLIDDLVELTNAGAFDDAIREVQKMNRACRRK